MATQSVELNPANAFGWACLGVAESHLGNPQQALSMCKRAREIVGVSPLRYHIDILSAIVAIMAGEYEQARHFGEISHSASPSLVAPLRFLIAVYFHQGNSERAYELVEKIRQVEPDFQPRHLLDKDYPSESLRKSALVKSIPIET